MEAKSADPRGVSERAERVLQAPGSERSRRSVRTGVAASVSVDSKADFKGLLVSLDFDAKYGDGLRDLGIDVIDAVPDTAKELVDAS